MVATEHTMREVGVRLAACLLVSASLLGATSGTAEDGAKGLADPTALVEAVTRPGPPARLSKGYFDNNPGCVSAKLDIWFERGRHSHQLFAVRADESSGPPSPFDATTSKAPQPEGSDKSNPAFLDSMDAQGTTIFVGGDGCRFRVRIERAE